MGSNGPPLQRLLEVHQNSLLSLQPTEAQLNEASADRQHCRRSGSQREDRPQVPERGDEEHDEEEGEVEEEEREATHAEGAKEAEAGSQHPSLAEVGIYGADSSGADGAVAPQVPGCGVDADFASIEAAAHAVVREQSLRDWINSDVDWPDNDAEWDETLVRGASKDLEVIWPQANIHLRGLHQFMFFFLRMVRAIPDMSWNVLDVVWGNDTAEVTFSLSGTQLEPVLSMLPVGKFIEWKLVSSITFDDAGLVNRDIMNVHADHLAMMCVPVSVCRVLIESAPVLALMPHGTRFLQEIIELTPDTCTPLLDNIHGRVPEFAKSHHANHLLQKYIVAMPEEAVQFMIDGFCGQAIQVARHCTACRVLQRLIECCSSELTKSLVEELMEAALELLTDRYGNFVVQGMLEYGGAETKAQLANVICSNAGRLARHWVSSNVVRCALMHCSREDGERIAHAIAPDTQEWMKILKHRHASFIAREIKAMRKSAQSEEVVSL